MAVAKRSSKTKKRSAIKKKTVRKGSAKKPQARVPSPKRLKVSDSQFKAFKTLEGKLQQTIVELRRSARAGNIAAVIKHRNALALLLGECDYLAHEYARCLGKKI